MVRLLPILLLVGCVSQPVCPPAEVIIVRDDIPAFEQPRLKIITLTEQSSTEEVIKTLVSDIMTLKASINERDNVLDSFRAKDPLVTH
jgi:hypothetical protein